MAVVTFKCFDVLAL